MKVEMWLAESNSSSRKRYQTRNQALHRSEEKIEIKHEENAANKQRNSKSRKRRSVIQVRKNKEGKTGLGVSVRKREESDKEVGNEFTQSDGKRTILSWLVDSGAVSVNGMVWYMDCSHTVALLGGRIKRDGILCNCCERTITVTEFEVHAGSKLCKPYLNTVVVETGNSLFKCQFDAWNRHEEECARRVSLKVNMLINQDDPTDDVCGVCGDGGVLICCDSCPSTFHDECLGIQKVPQGEWHCPNCLCKYCELVGGNANRLLTCIQCQEKYHQGCIREADAALFDRSGRQVSLCGQSCKKVFEKMLRLIGTRNELAEGFSWSLIRRLDQRLGSKTSLYALVKSIELNSKIAIARKVMDECFMPIIDRRSDMDMIQNVVYSRGSSYNRLNYTGFYTAVLERSDEIISVASIRIHGTRLAEMPFIGTRRMYRGQGMCRRLLNAIESALCDLNVEKLIIPSIPESVKKWTNGFGFKPIEDLLRQEGRFMNLLMFPDTVALQKLLLKPIPTKETETASTNVKAIGPQSNNYQLALDVLNRSLEAASAGLNHKTPHEAAVNNSSVMSERKPYIGVFYTVDFNGNLGIARLSF